MLLTYNTERTHCKAALSPVRIGVNDLPPELLVEILGYLHFKDILRCQSVSVCRDFSTSKLIRHVGMSTVAGCRQQLR